MTILDEALAEWDEMRNRFDPPLDDDPIQAAARNWQTLTDPTDELLSRMVRAFLFVDDGRFPYLIEDEEWQAWWKVNGGNYRDAMRAAVDALTVTAEPPTEEM